MKRVGVVLFCLAMANVPLFAQEIDWGIWAVSPTLQGDNRIDDVNDIEIQLDENIGYGFTGDIRWTDMFSTELGLYGFDADGTMNLGFLDEQIDLGSLGIMPVTATVRLHFGSDRFDVYGGAGAAYVIIDDIRSSDLELTGTDLIEVDDVVTWLVNAGVAFHLSDELGIGVDAKWISLDADTVSDSGQMLTLQLDPLMISAGLFMRF